MSIQPALISSPGTITGLNARLAEANRRLSRLEANRAGGGSGGTGPIDGSRIIDGTLNVAALDTGAITAEYIDVGAIDAGHIQADAIKTIHLDAGVVTANELAVDAVYADSIQANAVTTVQLSAGAVYAENIQTDAVTAEKINVETLSAIASNMGAITGGTITGGTIQTATGGARVVIDSLGLRGYALDGVTKTLELNIGTGIASFTGIATLDPNSVVPTGTLSGFLTGGNLVPNSSFEQGVNADTNVDQWFEGWELGNATAAKNTTFNVHGNNSAALTASSAANMWIGRFSAANRVRVRPGRKYSISAFTRAATTARWVDLYFYFWDAAGTLVGSGSTPISMNSTTDWTRHSGKTIEAPAGSATMGFLVHVNAPAAGEVHYVDAIQVEEGDTLSAYQPLATEILYSSIRSLFIGAGQVKANQVDAGAITAQKISVALPGGSVTLNNGNFREPVSGGVVPGWQRLDAGAGTVAVEDDASFGKVVKLTNATAANTYLWQAVTLPKGRHVISGWIKTSNVQAGYSAALNTDLASGTATLTPDVLLTGTNDWTRAEIAVDVTSATALINIYLQLGYAGNGTGTAWFAQMAVQSSIGSTLITPNAITTDHIFANTIQGGDIAGTTITGGNIAGQTITAGKMNVATLGAIQAELGTVQSGTITGSFIRTAAFGTRIELDTLGFRQYIGSSATPSIHFKTDGSDSNVFTGQLLARGITFPGSLSLGSTFSTANWETSGGIRYAQITGARDSAGVEFLRMDAGPGGTSTMARIDLSTNNGGNALIHVSAFQGGTGIVDQLLSHTGASAFLRGPAGYASRSRFQFGSTTFFAYAQGGAQSVTVTLGTAWSVTHEAFVCSLAPEQTLDGFSSFGGGVLSNNAGIAYYYNTTMGQNIILSFISIGY